MQLSKPKHGKGRPSRGAAPQEKEDLFEGKLSYDQSGRFASSRAGEMRVLCEQDQICRSTSANLPAPVRAFLLLLLQMRRYIFGYYVMYT